MIMIGFFTWSRTSKWPSLKISSLDSARLKNVLLAFQISCRCGCGWGLLGRAARLVKNLNRKCPGVSHWILCRWEEWCMSSLVGLWNCAVMDTSINNHEELYIGWRVSSTGFDILIFKNFHYHGATCLKEKKVWYNQDYESTKQLHTNKNKIG